MHRQCHLHSVRDGVVNRGIGRLGSRDRNGRGTGSGSSRRCNACQYLDLGTAGHSDGLCHGRAGAGAGAGHKLHGPSWRNAVGQVVRAGCGFLILDIDRELSRRSGRGDCRKGGVVRRTLTQIAVGTSDTSDERRTTVNRGLVTGWGIGQVHLGRQDAVHLFPHRVDHRSDRACTDGTSGHQGIKGCRADDRCAGQGCHYNDGHRCVGSQGAGVRNAITRGIKQGSHAICLEEGKGGANGEVVVCTGCSNSHVEAVGNIALVDHVVGELHLVSEECRGDIDQFHTSLGRRSRCIKGSSRRHVRSNHRIGGSHGEGARVGRRAGRGSRYASSVAIRRAVQGRIGSRGAACERRVVDHDHEADGACGVGSHIRHGSRELASGKGRGNQIGRGASGSTGFGQGRSTCSAPHCSTGHIGQARGKRIRHAVRTRCAAGVVIADGVDGVGTVCGCRIDTRDSGCTACVTCLAGSQCCWPTCAQGRRRGHSGLGNSLVGCKGSQRGQVNRIGPGNSSHRVGNAGSGGHRNHGNRRRIKRCRRRGGGGGNRIGGYETEGSVIATHRLYKASGTQWNTGHKRCRAQGSAGWHAGSIGVSVDHQIAEGSCGHIVGRGNGERVGTVTRVGQGVGNINGIASGSRLVARVGQRIATNLCHRGVDLIGQGRLRFARSVRVRGRCLIADDRICRRSDSGHHHGHQYCRRGNPGTRQ